MQLETIQEHFTNAFTQDFSEIPETSYDNIWIQRTGAAIGHPMELIEGKWFEISHNPMTGRKYTEEIDVNKICSYTYYYNKDEKKMSKL